MSISQSVFNQQIPNFKFWSKRASDLEMLTQGSPSHHLRARKRNHSSDDLKSRHYFIQNNLLYYKKSAASQRISNVTDLSWSRVHYQTYVTVDFGVLRKITLVKNNKFSSFFPPNADEFQKWKNALRTRCVLTDFEQRYVKVGVLLEKESYQVNLISLGQILKKLKLKPHRF